MNLTAPGLGRIHIAGLLSLALLGSLAAHRAPASETEAAAPTAAVTTAPCRCLPRSAARPTSGRKPAAAPIEIAALRCPDAPCLDPAKIVFSAPSAQNLSP
jgi:hypothetical protein